MYCKIMIGPRQNQKGREDNLLWYSRVFSSVPRTQERS